MLESFPHTVLVQHLFRVFSLFDLKKDKWEKTDLADNPVFSKIKESLRSLLIKEMKDTYDNLDITKPDWGRVKGMKTNGGE